MDLFVKYVGYGLASGVIYASLALALVVVYRATGLINFAQGEMAMVSTYFAWALLTAGVSYWLILPVTVAASVAFGAAVERWVIRRVASEDHLPVVVVLIGVLVALNSLAGWTFTYITRDFPSPFPSEPVLPHQLVSSHELGAAATLILVMLAIYAFFRFTRMGLAMRATADNPQSARLVGIRVDATVAATWGIASGIGAVAGLMIAPTVFLEPNMMSGVLLYSLAGALLGGIDSPAGAVIGGLIVGVLENLLGGYVVGSELKLATALVIIVAILVFVPNGLFGRTVVTRV